MIAWQACAWNTFEWQKYRKHDVTKPWHTLTRRRITFTWRHKYMNVTHMTPKNNYMTYDYITYNYMMTFWKIVTAASWLHISWIEPSLIHAAWTHASWTHLHGSHCLSARNSNLCQSTLAPRILSQLLCEYLLSVNQLSEKILISATLHLV